VVRESVIDVAVLCERGDEYEGDPEAIAVGVDLGRGDVIIPAAIVVPGQEYRAPKTSTGSSEGL